MRLPDLYQRPPVDGTAVQYATPSRIVGAVKEGTRSAVGLCRYEINRRTDMP